jgi:hypothetical protein
MKNLTYYEALLFPYSPILRSLVPFAFFPMQASEKKFVDKF